MSVAAMIGSATGRIDRMTAARDAAGGIVQSWEQLYTNVPMRDEIGDSRIEEIGGQKKLVVSHTVYTQQSGITQGMRIVFDGIYLAVIGVDQRRARSPAIPDWYEVHAEEHKSMPS